MKKQYQSPRFHLFPLQPTTILAASGHLDYGGSDTGSGDASIRPESLLGDEADA